MRANGDEYVLAIDLGTSGPKVALASTKGEILAYEFEPTRLLLFPNGGAEQDPDDWWRAITEAARRLLARQPAERDKIAAVCCTAQWSGTVAVDEGGRHLMNAIIWMDSRGAPYVKRITGGPIEFEGYGIDKLPRWLRLTSGIPAHSGKDSLAHILYIKHALPEVYRQTFKFLEPKDYINLRLSGRFAASYDSIALHWVTDNRDLSRVIYDERLLQRSTVERGKLPDLKRAVDVLGPLRPDAAAALGLAEGIPVVMGTPDLQSAAVGSGAVRDYEAHLYIGTSSWITCHVPFKKTDVFHNMATLPAAIPERYFVANEQETAGACLTFLRDNVFFAADGLASAPASPVAYAAFDKVAQGVPAGSGGVIFTPWLYGERTPVEDHTVRGGFYNLSLQTTRAHMVRAVLEGVAYNARWLCGYVEQFAGCRFEAINMIGGGANSKVWCQIHADVLQRTIRQMKDPLLANARGAALLASVALGKATFDDIAACIEFTATYEPDPGNRAAYDALYNEFANIYKNMRRIYARLNGAR